MNYEVTIGIPLYNAERFIGRAIESALEQTFGSIEFLIVDDCGTDGSADIVRRIQEEHPRGGDIRMVRQPVNMGVGSARNRIIDEARGRYLYFMDADDLIERGTIELLYSNMKRTGAEIVFGSYEKIEEYGDTHRSEKHLYPDMELLSEDALACFAFRRYGGIQASVWNYLVDTGFLRRTGHRFVRASYWEDMVFTYTLTTYVSCAVLLSDVTYYYMCREDSLSNYQRRERIGKEEVLRNVATVDHLKRHTARLTGKPYVGNWCCNVVMTYFYIVCNVMKNRAIIHPGIGNSELRSFMSHPLRLGGILRLGGARWKNLFLFILGKLPPRVFAGVVYMLGKRKGLI